ncbi:uncharacterized protein LOC126837858 [Adelges cooleyi]|uniref:uncharacterized protein LOC126837858 n=1 Tax=Adelges cooleyi TaxID=133065 RepID=UPI00217FBDB1|nr:uncharacterized protein LOC126837858 [Adelges cooleyi]
MVSIKIVLAVTVMVLAVAQCAQVQVVRTVEIQRTRPGSVQGDIGNIEYSMSDLVKQFKEALSNLNEKYNEMAKQSFNDLSDQLKSQLDQFSQMMEENVDVPQLLKDATRKYQAAMNSLIQHLPDDISLKNIEQKFERAKRNIINKSAELMKKAHGSSAQIKKEIADFAEKQLQYLIENIRALQMNIAEHSS